VEGKSGSEGPERASGEAPGAAAEVARNDESDRSNSARRERRVLWRLVMALRVERRVVGGVAGAGESRTMAILGEVNGRRERSDDKEERLSFSLDEADKDAGRRRMVTSMPE
jgi:hypothetical protein